jgi:hypothetical protein
MFLCGFRLFTTGRKNHNDLRRGVTPLWRPRDQPSFAFGGRYGGLIKHPVTHWTMTDPRDDQRSAAVVLEQIRPFVREFEAIQTTADFLSYFAFMRPNSTVQVQLDFALADYLAGDMDGCEKALSYVEGIFAADHEEKWYMDLRPIVAQIRRQFDADPDGLRDLIHQWRDENAAWLGLVRSC